MRQTQTSNEILNLEMTRTYFENLLKMSGTYLDLSGAYLGDEDLI